MTDWTGEKNDWTLERQIEGKLLLAVRIRSPGQTAGTPELRECSCWRPGKPGEVLDPSCLDAVHEDALAHFLGGSSSFSSSHTASQAFVTVMFSRTLAFYPSSPQLNSLGVKKCSQRHTTYVSVGGEVAKKRCLPTWSYPAKLPARPAKAFL